MELNIVFMVGIVMREKNKVEAYKLFNLGRSQSVVVQKDKLVELLKKNYRVANLKLSNNGKIEVVPRSCGIRRYTWFDTAGRVIEEHNPKVLVSKFNGRDDREVCLIYNTITERLEIFNYDRSVDNNIDYVANLMDLSDSIENTLHEDLIAYWSENTEQYEKLKYELNQNLNLSDFAVYLPNEDFKLNGCVWVENMHHSSCRKMEIGGSVYGLGCNAVKSCRFKELVLDVQFLESAAVVDSEIGTLRLGNSIWYTGADLIKNCVIGKLIIEEDVPLNGCLLVDCQIKEIEFIGKHIKMRKGYKELMRGCIGLEYITLNRKISDKYYEIMSRLTEGDAKILLRDTDKKT